MKTLIPILILSLLLTSCDVSASTIQILKDQGYDNVQITGFNLLACSEDDMFRYNFVANAPNGNNVRGVVCSAPLKGYTIRLFPN